MPANYDIVGDPAYTALPLNLQDVQAITLGLRPDYLAAKQRSYRATQLSYRQALATYMLAGGQLREAVGTRKLS